MNLNHMNDRRLERAPRFSHGPVTGGILILCVLLLLAAGCAAPSEQAAGQTPTPAKTGTSSTATPSAAGVVTAAPADSLLTLIWWAPEFLSPKAAQPAGPLLAEQLAAFGGANNGKIAITIVPKARYGKGGLLDYLRTAAPVAPTILPDLIALDVSELEVAAGTGLLQPLDGLLDESVMDDLYPFAVAAGRFGEHVLAVQYAADLEHLIYRRDLVPTPPATWADLVAEPVGYLLPLSSQQPGASGQPARGLPDILLSQYLSAGASYDQTTRKLVLEREPLERLFTFYQDAVNEGILPKDPAQPWDAETVWNSYGQDKAPLADISARRYLAEGGNLKDTAYAAAPGYAAPLKAVPSGWALAVITSDPARQRAAAAVIAWLLRPERQGAWTAAAGWLPTSPAALEQWGEAEYTQFLADQLADAVSLPAGADSAQAAAQLKQGWESVIKGENSPAAAAEALVSPPK